MTYSKPFTQAKWYVNLMERFETLRDRLKLPEDSASEIKVFMLEIAREQYMAGNKSGIAWLKKQQAETASVR